MAIQNPAYEEMVRLPLPRITQSLGAACCVVVALGTLGFGLFAIFPPTGATARDRSGLRALGLLVAAWGFFLLFLSVRMLRARVLVGRGEVIVSSTWRTRRISASSIDQFVVQRGSSAYPFMPWYVFAARLQTGDHVPFQEGRSRSQKRMQAAADGANHLLIRSKEGE